MEETLRALLNSEVDALVVPGNNGDGIFSLRGAEYPYRVMIEAMHEGAVTLAADGSILYCNQRFAAMVNVPLERYSGGT